MTYSWMKVIRRRDVALILSLVLIVQITLVYPMSKVAMISSFAIEYYKITGRPIVGVSCSKGGTSINLWQPSGAFLNDAIARFHAAKSWLTANGYTIKNKFIVWCQGET